VTAISTKAAEAGAFFTEMRVIYCRQCWQVARTALNEQSGNLCVDQGLSCCGSASFSGWAACHWSYVRPCCRIWGRRMQSAPDGFRAAIDDRLHGSIEKIYPDKRWSSRHTSAWGFTYWLHRLCHRHPLAVKEPFWATTVECPVSIDASQPCRL